MPAEAIRLLPFETEFTRAWDTPGHTRYGLPDTDVTRAMLWDMETRKAARPGTYIPFVVRAGSDRSWNRRTGDGGEYLDRCSMQRLWLNPQRCELILERAFLNHHDQKVTFLGVHSVGGTELQPLNRWRIVHLTDAPDERLIEGFDHMAASPWLAEHTEI